VIQQQAEDQSPRSEEQNKPEHCRIYDGVGKYPYQQEDGKHAEAKITPAVMAHVTEASAGFTSPRCAPTWLVCR
jgi:hypothetical protein